MISDQDYEELEAKIIKEMIASFADGELTESDACDCLYAIRSAGYALVPIAKAREIGCYPPPERDDDGEDCDYYGRRWGS